LGGKDSIRYYDDTLLTEVCDPSGVKLFIIRDPTIMMSSGGPPLGYDRGYPDHLIGGYFHRPDLCNHNWQDSIDANYDGTYDLPFHDHLKRVADSMTCHIVNGKPIKDHDAFYGYFVCAEGPEAYCPQCNEAIESLCYWIKENDPNPDHKTWAWINNLWLKDTIIDTIVTPPDTVIDTIIDWKVKDSLWDICQHLDVICFVSYSRFQDDKLTDDLRKVLTFIKRSLFF